MNNIKIQTGRSSEFLLGNGPIKKKSVSVPLRKSVQDRGTLSSYQITRLNKNQKDRIADYLVRKGRRSL